MFFPRAMTELELIVPAKDLLAVTKILSSYGVFHQTDSAYPNVNTGSANTWQETAALYAALERRIQVILQSLSIDEGEPSSADHDAMKDVEKLRQTVDEVEGNVKEVSDQLAAEKKRLEQFETVLRQLEPVAALEIDIAALRKPHYTYSMLGLIPAANIDRLQTSLARVPNVFITLRSDPQKPVVWLAGSQSNADVLDRAAKSAYLDPLMLPEGYDGTPAKIIASLHTSIEETKQKIEELKSALARYTSEHKQELLDLLRQAHTSRVLSDAIVRYGQLKHTYVVTGWVPVDDLESLTIRLKNASREILIETLPTTRHGHTDNVPVALFNNKFLKPFQMLVNMYARPSYGELDPTLLLALTFPLLYGAMFGDIGQGLVLALAGWLITTNKIKALKGMSSLGGIILSVGIMATIFGFLYGSFFAFEGELAEKYLGLKIHPLWVSPIHEILPVLGLSIDLGIVLLIIGFLIGIFNQFRAKDWAHFVFGHTGLVGLAFYLSFLGILGNFLGKTPIAPHIAVAIASLPIPLIPIAALLAIGVMFSSLFRNLMEGHRPLIDDNIGTYLFGSFMELFEVTISLLSNTLSYVRVGAFAVAHGGLSMAFFKIAGDTPNFGFWITLLIGNIFFVVIEALIVGIQTMRLSYYELFSKFFTGGGMRFAPLRLTPSDDE